MTTTLTVCVLGCCCESPQDPVATKRGGKAKAADPSLPARSLSRFPFATYFNSPFILRQGRALQSLFSNLAPHPVGGTIAPQASFRNAS